MITHPQSRYRHCLAHQDASGRWYLAPRRRLRFRDLPDNRVHVASGGESLWELADRYFQPLVDADKLYWAICDFQPTPLPDATIALVPGQRLFIPSVATVRDYLSTGGRRAGTR